jgi:MraZ protein
MKNFYKEYFVKLDDRNRVKLPTVFNEILANHFGKEIVLMRMPEKCIAIYPSSTFEKEYSEFLAKIKNKLPGSGDYRALSRLSGSGRSMVIIDKQGRVPLSEGYRTYLEVKDSDELAVIGAEDRIELWKKENWLEYLNTKMASYDSLVQEIVKSEGYDKNDVNPTN